jgi:hypothetical protein
VCGERDSLLRACVSSAGERESERVRECERVRSGERAQASERGERERESDLNSSHLRYLFQT